MKIYFETSALNSFRSDPNVSRVTDHLQRNHEVWISALNLCEIAGTADKVRRLELCMFASVLSRRNPNSGYRIFPIETKVLKQDLRRYLVGDTRILPSDIELEGHFIPFLDRPQEIVEDFVSDLWQYQNRRTERNIAEGFREVRAKPITIELTDTDREILKEDLPGFVRRIAEETDVLHGLLEVVLSSEEFIEMNPLTLGRVHEIFNDLTSWRCFILSGLVEMYNRLFRDTHYGPKTNPGWHDMKQIVYLSKVDIFVSDDRRQREHAQAVSQLANLECKVVGYGEFVSLIEGKE